MTQVPTGVRRQGNSDIRQSDAGQLVTIRIDSRNQVGIGFANLGGQERRFPFIHPWPKVESGDGAQMCWELYSWHGLECGGGVPWGYRRAIVEARMKAWRRSLPLRYP